LVKIIQTIIKRLKTGCQWRELSVKDYFGEENTAELSVHQKKIKDFQQDLRVLLLSEVYYLNKPNVKNLFGSPCDNRKVQTALKLEIIFSPYYFL